MLFAPTPAGAPVFPYADKVVHLGVFAAVTAAAVWRFGRVRPVLALVAAYAPASEVVQGLVLPQRQADPWDAAVDLLGVAAVWLVSRRRAGASRA
ncbi:MAG: VanZ family protein [Actinomycetota bacterium]|nr:VanZ family protein [Actinomycetota bacterium]